MIIGIVGLGLIGGSLAKAIKFYTPHTVYAYDSDENTQRLAMLVGAADAALTEETLPACSFLFLALYPTAALDYLKENAARLTAGAIVIDCAGIKRPICEEGFALAAAHDFHFIGGHPMAGTQFSGFRNARETLFRNAAMLLVPKPNEDIYLLEQVKALLSSLGFSRVTLTTAAHHDAVIAFTSQLAHVLSNAYVKSETAKLHKDFSAGSYQDLTRVAYLNETMWTELFLLNGDFLADEIHHLADELLRYEDAIRAQDADTLQQLLREGRECKQQIDYVAKGGDTNGTREC